MHTPARLGLASALLAGAALAAPAVAAPSIALKAAAPSSGKSVDSGPRTDKASSSKTSKIVRTCPQDDGSPAGTITFEGATALWPPNHKMVPVQITWADEDAQDSLGVVWRAAHDQFAEDGSELQGSGNTSDDITPATQPGDRLTGTGSITQPFQVRAERSGTRGEGRTYTIAGTAFFSDSDNDGSSEDVTSCDFSFDIVVPHDQGKGAGNSGTAS